ncbi:MAG: hypothetical protein IJ793_03620 [Opitutales bacterium]|nr:hypothetical protein [Opitutales bacterium]
MQKEDKEKPHRLFLGCHFGFPALYMIGLITGFVSGEFFELEIYGPLLFFFLIFGAAFPLFVICRTTYSLSARFMAKQQRFFIFCTASIPYSVFLCRDRGIVKKTVESLWESSVGDRLPFLFDLTGSFYCYVVVIYLLSVFITFVIFFPFRKKESALQKINGIFAKITPFVFWAGWCFFLLFSAVSFGIGARLV